MTITSEYGPAFTREHASERLTLRRETVELWRQFWGDRDLDARNELVVTYEPLVRKTIAKLPVNIRAIAESDDLYSFGVLGLIDAINKCSAERDLNRFPAYASYRIKGTIIDELRRLDWVPRTIRRQLTAYRTSVDELSNELGRMPRHSEVIASLDLDAKSSYNVLLDAVLAQSPERPMSNDDARWADAFVSTRSTMPNERCDPADHVVNSEQHARLHDAIDRLSERQRLVIKQRFGAGYTQHRIAEGLGVTTARVCQIEASAIHSLRCILRAAPAGPRWAPPRPE